jgi:hypothetical protein
MGRARSFKETSSKDLRPPKPSPQRGNSSGGKESHLLGLTQSTYKIVSMGGEAH